MRAHELTEIIRMPKNSFNIRKSDMANFSVFDKGFEQLPGGSDLIYVVRSRGDYLGIFIGDPKTKDSIGQLKLTKNKNFPMPNAHVVDVIIVDPDRRGEGIAKSLYGIYLGILKYPLLAGHDQTPGGRRNWLSLANVPGVVVRGYVPIRDDDFDQDDTRPDYVGKKFERLIDNVMRMGGDYLGKKNGIHYFAFDVEPGTGELEPVVKDQLKLYGYHDLVNPGLYAVWSGK